jgi:N-acetylglutamate synthase-like GNAT family acetyltransferase
LSLARRLTNATITMSITLRTDLRPGDLGRIVTLHGSLYAREYGFDATFEAYVAGPLAAFVKKNSPRERLWLAELDGHLVGCIAIVAASKNTAQLRWYLVDPSARGQGLGKRLMTEALDFCKACGYESVFLWTVSSLTTAAKIYQAAGFEKVESIPAKQWGVDVIEERYVLRFRM